jgi:hypothetical protein
MEKFDFKPLYGKYTEIIAEMPMVFTAHEFILRLAHQNQKLYIEALYAYREVPHTDLPAPFLNVHRILTTQLHAYPELVEQVRKHAPSRNIFGESIACTEWKKL